MAGGGSKANWHVKAGFVSRGMVGRGQMTMIRLCGGAVIPFWERVFCAERGKEVGPHM
jgi:hypothetical protein